MEDQDKLYEQFRASAEKAEEKGFDRMEALWNRVEDKLDREKQRKSAQWWKYTGMAAVLLLFITVGAFLYQNETAQDADAPKIVVIDMEKAEKTLGPSADDTLQEEVVADNTPAPRSHQTATDIERIDFTSKVKLIPGKKVVANIATLSLTDAPSAEILEKATDFKVQAAGAIAFSGTVTDNEGIPLPGAIVKVAGTDTMVQSDMDGRYTIDTKEGSKIIASYVGMNSASILAYKANDNKKVVLNEDATTLDDVVVSSYRAKSAASLTAIPTEDLSDRNRGFVQSANSMTAEIEEGKVRKEKAFTATEKATPATGQASNAMTAQQPANASPELQGLTGRVQAVPSGEPGHDPRTSLVCRFPSSVQVGEPLYVVDGVPVSSDVMKSLDSSNIVNIIVLKDSSATAVYGKSGKDGVIIIKTKNGLTKREKRKLDREAKKAYKQTQKKLKAANKG